MSYRIALAQARRDRKVNQAELTQTQREEIREAFDLFDTDGRWVVPHVRWASTECACRAVPAHHHAALACRSQRRD